MIKGARTRLNRRCHVLSHRVLRASLSLGARAYLHATVGACYPAELADGPSNPSPDPSYIHAPCPRTLGLGRLAEEGSLNTGKISHNQLPGDTSPLPQNRISSTVGLSSDPGTRDGPLLEI